MNLIWKPVKLTLKISFVYNKQLEIKLRSHFLQIFQD